MGWTLSDFMRTRMHELRQPSPLLQFYEVAIPDGTFQRFVDFADPQSGGSLPSRVPFNGVEFTAMPIARGSIQESAEGGSWQMSVAVIDPLHTVAFFIRSFRGLSGQSVRFWIAPFDDLAHPEDAFSETFEINSSSISQGPDAVTFVLGHPNLFEVRVPRIKYDRRKCYNPYHDRFIPGNWCTYPSNEFDGQRAENFLSGAGYENQARKHGWITSHAIRASVFDSHVTNPEALIIASSDSRIAWSGRERYGPALFRLISGDFDVETYITDLWLTRTGWFAGLFVQDQSPACPVVPEGQELPVSPAPSWAIWGPTDDGAGSRRLRFRAAMRSWNEGDVPIASTDLFLRLVRSGNTLTAYSKASAGGAWVSRQAWILVQPADVYVGLVLASDSRGSNIARARFEYLRFNSGGFGSCKRTWEDCSARGNTIQFNGYREIPSDRARY